MNQLRKHSKKIASLIIVTMLFGIFSPMTGYAITGHKSMPEYQSFEPAATSNMVNMFDGSFTYNIPLINVPNGYPINLSYHSNNVTNEAMSSWVGLGWNINPGTINRIKRGFPDEFDGETVKYYSRTEPNWTIAGSASLNPELFGDESLIDLGISGQLRYNNYTGIGKSLTTSVGFAGIGASLSLSNGRFGFRPSVNPAGLFSGLAKIGKKTADTDEKEIARTKAEKFEGKINKQGYKSVQDGDKTTLEKMEGSTANSPQFSFGFGGFGVSSSPSNAFSYTVIPEYSMPTVATPYTGYAGTMEFALGVNALPVPVELLEPKIGITYTRQTNTEEQSVEAYGYFHSENALASGKEASMMDYYTENESPYERRDNVLGYPIANSDYFSLTGEALGGSFRAFRREYGHYRKNEVASKDFAGNLLTDVNIPGGPHLVFTAGSGIGGSYHELTVKDWADKGTADDFKFESDDNFVNSDEKFAFLFAGDLGGYHDLSGDDLPFRNEITIAPVDIPDDTEPVSSVMLGWTDYGLTDHFEDDRETASRTSYISYRLNSEGREKVTLGGSEDILYKMNEKKAGFVNSSGDFEAYDYTAYNEDEITEYSVYNSDGVKYVYGLPVHIRNERSLKYSAIDQGNIDATPDDSKILADVTGADDSELRRKFGVELEDSYPYTYLLTQIVAPDYVDRKQDGPTPDDFGSYTKFNYKRHKGGNDWYAYRTPYKKSDYHWGSLSDKKDDMVGFEFGEKEMQYIHSIESKTHIAIFSTSSREDGRGAKLNDTSNDDEVLKGTDASVTEDELLKLDRIDLYSLTDCEIVDGVYTPLSGAVPIQTVHFAYDYTLCGDVPNNLETSGPKGKLTLTKVWFEYEGKLKSKIAPYEFHYNYFTGTYPTKYSALEGYGTNLEENPDYAAQNTDRWGNYRDFDDLESSIGDLAYFYPFVDQGPTSTGPDQYDPAAFCLKRIKLPSGGEIHVQYEQNDYAFVQDKWATMMCPLLGDGVTGTDLSEKRSDIKDKKYYLDVSKIGITFSSLSDQQEFVDQLFMPMAENLERMYFNFLYALVGDNPDYRYTHTDYIEGYGRIDGYGYDATGPFFMFKKTTSPTATYFKEIDYSSLEAAGGTAISGTPSRRELPRVICREFVKTQRAGKITGEANALEGSEASGDGEALGLGFINMIKAFELSAGSKCQEFDPEMSYVRVGLPIVDGVKIGKLGGGVRVKRLLMYDEGLTTTEKVLYGSEYSYTTSNPLKTDEDEVISSGVATMEPSVGRRENPLVLPIEKDPQKRITAMLFGRDLQNQEGPIGESLYPAASVGYSKVTVKSIHSGTTGTGREEHEFYTCRDYPFIGLSTRVKKLMDWPPITAAATSHSDGSGLGISVDIKSPYLSQGYSFVERNMHGRVKRISKFASGDVTTPFAYEIYEYFDPRLPDQEISVMNENNVVETITYKKMGKQAEILSEARRVNDLTVRADFDLDLSAGTTLPIPIPIVIPTKVKAASFGLIDHRLTTHVTTKQISYTPIVKRVINHADGVTHYTENLVFDKYTGNPVVVKTYDDFKGAYFNEDFMASWNYLESGPRYRNDNLLLRDDDVGGVADYSFNASTKTITVTPGSGACVMDNFMTGDFIELSTNPPDAAISGHALYHIESIDYAANQLVLVESGMHTATMSGTVEVNIDILSSGASNELTLKVGNTMRFIENGDMPTYLSNVLGTNDFTDDLNTAINDNIVAASSSPTEFTISEIYSNVDARGVIPSHLYGNPTLDPCIGDGSSITVQNPVFELDYTGGVLTLTLISFETDGCGTVSCSNYILSNANNVIFYF